MVNFIINIQSVFRFCFIVMFFFSCSKKNNFEKNSDTCKVIDSLQSLEYSITKEINYFEMIPYTKEDTFKDKDLFFAIKKDSASVSILECSCYDTYRKRLIKKYSDNFFIEKQVLNNNEAGEIDHITIYYSLKKIIVTVITQSTFADQQNNAYLKDIFILDNDSVTNYTYIFNSDLNLKDVNVLLSENQLLKLNNYNAKKLFFNESNVKVYKFVNKDFAKEDTHIYQYFLLPDIKGSKASDVFR